MVPPPKAIVDFAAVNLAVIWIISQHDADALNRAAMVAALAWPGKHVIADT